MFHYQRLGFNFELQPSTQKLEALWMDDRAGPACLKDTHVILLYTSFVVDILEMGILFPNLVNLNND